MRVSSTKPFSIIYSLLRHEYLGYILDCHAVQEDVTGKLTLQFQTISPANFKEFAINADRADKELVELIDRIRQENIVKRHSTKKVTVNEFFLKYFAPNAKPDPIKDLIVDLVEDTKSRIMKLLPGKRFFVQGPDGNPAWQPLEFSSSRPTIRFHFHRNEDDTHYYPTLKWEGQKLEFYRKGAAIICNSPATLMMNGFIFFIQGNVDGRKLSAFMEKKFVSIPRKVEETYFKKFVAPLIENEDVVANGFIINKVLEDPVLVLRLAIMQPIGTLFSPAGEEPAKVKGATLKAFVRYDGHELSLHTQPATSVISEKANDTYRFTKIFRDTQAETRLLAEMESRGMAIGKSGFSSTLSVAFDWLQANQEWLDNLGAEVHIEDAEKEKYAFDRPVLQLDTAPGIDWFEVRGMVRFGRYEVPFHAVRRAILRGEQQVKAEDGTWVHIPGPWLEALREVFQLGKITEDGEGIRLAKFHGALLTELLDKSQTQGEEVLAADELLRQIAQPTPVPMPKQFNGTLRNYQLTGYHWLHAMRDAGLGACLADDMGLGKTIQTLALLAYIKEKEPKTTHLLVVPNSLIFNWEREAKRFVPGLRLLRHIGSQREKSHKHFSHYHLVVTSYGTLRADIELFEKQPFGYVILDEAHAIKNHNSSTAKAVNTLRAKHRLSLTGTPIENNLTELWSQFQFLNPGLLGSLTWFRNEYAIPIEKSGNLARLQKLTQRIQPFIMRRLKTQVAAELPPKVEQVLYCEMAPEQEKLYNHIRDGYRQALFAPQFDAAEAAKQRFMILRGLTHLRQIACHPALTQEDYEGTSGKFESLTYKLKEAFDEHHKVLIFSQFVRHLDLVKVWLEQQGIPFALLTGKTKDRAGQADRFQQDPDCRAFLLSLKAGGTGLNLTAARFVVMLDPWWNPAAESQAIDRAHRIGQTHQVHIYRLITRGTVEEKIIDLQDRKRALTSSLLQADDAFGQLSTTEMKSLFD